MWLGKHVRQIKSIFIHPSRIIFKLAHKTATVRLIEHYLSPKSSALQSETFMGVDRAIGSTVRRYLVDLNHNEGLEKEKEISAVTMLRQDCSHSKRTPPVKAI